MKQTITNYQVFFNNITFWQIATAIEFAIILILVFRFKAIIKKNKSNGNDYIKNIIQESKATEVNMDNVINSMFHSKTLYDILKKKIHPDRFPNDEEKSKIADELATRLNEQKGNIQKLEEIKAIAKEKLGLTF